MPSVLSSVSCVTPIICFIYCTCNAFQGLHARGTLNLDTRTMAEFIASLDVSRTAPTSRSHRCVAVEDSKRETVKPNESTWDDSWSRWPSDAYWVPDHRWGSWKRGAIPEDYKWNEYAPRASQTASSSESIPLDETYAENPSALTPSFQLSGEKKMQTNTGHEQDSLERIRISNARKIELIDRKCAKYIEKFAAKLADKKMKALRSFAPSLTMQGLPIASAVNKVGAHVHSGAYSCDQRRQSHATKSGT